MRDELGGRVPLSAGEQVKTFEEIAVGEGGRRSE